MSLLIDHSYRFGEFTLDTDQRILLREGKPLSLAPKVFDTLLILVESSGRIVGKEELMNRLWPDTFVEEANLTFNIQQLRKALGDNARKPIYIETIARRGYRFIANVEEVLGDESATGGKINERLEISDAESGKRGESYETKLEAHELSPAIKPAGEDQQARPEKNLNAIPVSDAVSTSSGKKSLAIAAGLVMVLVGVVFVFWALSNLAKKNLSEDKRVESKAPVVSPLKLEKLTITGQSRYVAISPDGKYIAYTRTIEKKVSIWLRQLATNTNVEIVPATGLMYGLAFAHGGEYLYFVRADPTALYRVSLLGGVPTKIVDKLEGNFSLSSDDRQVAFVRRVVRSDGQNEYSLIIANSDGGNERTLVVRMYPERLDTPLWSPGNQSIICSYGSSEGGSQQVSIVEVKVADGTKTELSSDRFFNIGKMAWLPHKTGLIMVARKNAQDNKELWHVSYPRMEIDQITEGLSAFLDLSIADTVDKAVASQATRISDLWVGSSEQPRSLKKITQAMDEFCWTPNGRLVYQSTASGNRDLWITEPDGAGQKQLTNDPAVDGNPAVTPDRRYVVFTSNRTGVLQLWRMNMDGSNQIQLTDGAAKDFPAISPDGKWVLCNTTDDWHLWKVSIDGGEPVCLAGYPASFPAVSPDGKMIACLGRSDQRLEHSILILPFEGGRPLKRMDFTGAGFSKNRMQWTPDGKGLIYVPERAGPTVLVRQPLDGGLPEEIMDFGGDDLFDFGYSVDGRFLAVTRGEWQHDIVLISDLNRY
ncbi:MAG TPA: winged helix-turn-helix domain-containing protein [Blastocatellia bacterium]|nr:winged helix-turn-helix domain-containing protein [Blastocatellia bacterium]